MSIEIVGVLSRVVFEAKAEDFLVADFIDAQSAKRFRASGKIKVSSKSDAKQKYRLIGQWENNTKYGETFVVIYSEAERPTELRGIAPYLANNVKGVGEVTAKKLVQELGVFNIDDFVTICKNTPERIQSFFGEKKKKLAENIISMMVTDEVFRNIMIFLHEHNISPNFSKKIYNKYGTNSIKNLMDNPYRLIADFRQVGFLKADLIAQKLGIPNISPFRLEASFIYAMESSQDDGHCCLPRDLLIQRSKDLLGGKSDPIFSYDFVLEALRSIFKENREQKIESFLIREININQANKRETLFYLPEVMRMEDEVAGSISMLLKTPSGHEHREQEVQNKLTTSEQSLEDIFPEIPWVKLSEEQRSSVQMSLSSRFMILTGGPGCGKTFVLKAIFNLQRALNRKVALCAPTGLAAKRMSASIGENASTLHKLLGLGKRKTKTKNKENELETNIIEDFDTNENALDKFDVVVVDESSMISLDLLHALLTALGPNRRLILVGDVDQLPSVGPGNCLRDIIASKQVPISRLSKIFRQASESPIPIAARDIILGKKPEFSFISRTPVFSKAEAFPFIPCSVQTFFELLLPFLYTTVKDVYHLDPIKDCQILVPIRRSEVGQENINKILQNYLNPPSLDKNECELLYTGLLREGDKVIQTKNNYELDVFNGDLGYCKKITKTKESLEVVVEFNDKIVTFEDDEINDLQLCYAMTVHKSQGSEFPMCIIPMFSVYYTMLDRNLLYTAITRASRFAIIMGEEWALKKAIGSQNAIKRFTALDSLLSQLS